MAKKKGKAEPKHAMDTRRMTATEAMAATKNYALEIGPARGESESELEGIRVRLYDLERANRITGRLRCAIAKKAAIEAIAPKLRANGFHSEAAALEQAHQSLDKFIAGRYAEA